MEKLTTLSDTEFEDRFARGLLKPQLFTHEAHLRLAWIHVTRHGVEKAIENVCTQIKAFATAQGDADKYHVTVTVAAVRAVYHFILKSKSQTFGDFITEFPRLNHNFKALLNAHYKEDVFKSERAMRQFLEPDRAPFDPLPEQQSSDSLNKG